MELAIWLLIIGALLPIIYLGIGAYAAITLTKVGDHPQYDRVPSDFGVDYEAVHFPSRQDQLQLAAWYLPNSDALNAMILVHGRNASKQNAISGRMPELASALRKAGFAVLVLDLRGHGESEGKRYMWGVHERRDVLGAMDFLRTKGYSAEKIGVLGISLGGAAALGAVFQERQVGALVLDSTFASLEDLVDQNWKKEAGLPRFLLPGVFWMWRILFGFGIRDVRPVDEIRELDTYPILILHSKTDEAVPVSQALQMGEAAANAAVVLFDQCDHAELFRDQPSQYLGVLIPFLERVLQ